MNDEDWLRKRIRRRVGCVGMFLAVPFLLLWAAAGGAAWGALVATGSEIHKL